MVGKKTKSHAKRKKTKTHRCFKCGLVFKVPKDEFTAQLAHDNVHHNTFN
jgi:ribosomal protein L34E